MSLDLSLLSLTPSYEPLVQTKGVKPGASFVPDALACYNFSDSFSMRSMEHVLMGMLDSASHSSRDSQERVEMKKAVVVKESIPEKSPIEQVYDMLNSVHGNVIKLSLPQKLALKRMGAGIEVLDLTRETLTQKQVKQLAAVMPNVRYFTCKSLDNHALGGVKGFKKLFSLTVLNCKKTPITGEGLLQIKGLPLRELTLSHSTGVEQELHHFSRLERLSLQSVMTTKKMGQILQEHPTLTDFNGVVLEKPTEDELFELLDEVEGPIKTIYNLACHNLRDETFQILVQKHPTIEDIEFYGFQHMTDAALQPLKQLKNLKWLSLCNVENISQAEKQFWKAKKEKDSDLHVEILPHSDGTDFISGGPIIKPIHSGSDCDSTHSDCNSSCCSDDEAVDEDKEDRISE
jgi:hypothetical protein